jgi:hypothetical protein
MAFDMRLTLLSLVARGDSLFIFHTRYTPAILATVYPMSDSFMTLALTFSSSRIAAMVTPPASRQKEGFDWTREPRWFIAQTEWTCLIPRGYSYSVGL